MTEHKILVYKTPTDDEIHIDGITFSNREFLEEIINTLHGINMYNGHDADTKKILDYYFNIFSSQEDFPEQIIIKYTNDLIVDDYVLEYVEQRADFVFTVNEDNIYYESLRETNDEFAMEMYERIIELVNNF